MRASEFREQLERRRTRDGLAVALGSPASSAEIDSAARRLGIEFPGPVSWFYRAQNGFVVTDPGIEVLSLSELAFDQGRDLPFARLDGRHWLVWRTEGLNTAGQWDIAEKVSGYLVTRTMPSFWSNKVFAWIDQRRRIWTPEVDCRSTF